MYLHFPWCVRKCPYCDFNSHPLQGNLHEDAYTDALIRDFQANAAEGCYESVFLGGGTPSLFSARAIAKLLQALTPQLEQAAEVTMEANPGALERSEFAAYREAGVNRLSIGAQSFSGAMLTRLGRIHDADETLCAFADARSGGFDNINLDIMYGLPEQSPADALADLEQAIALGPEHLSWYQLTLEPRTEFARRPPQMPDEDAIAIMEDEGHRMLAEAGFVRYEVSAYARPGARCRHNLVYWTFGDYAGVGAGAAGKRSRRGVVVRTSKPRQPRLYLKNPLKVVETDLSTEDLPGEFMMNALRLADGLRRDCFEARTGLPWHVVAPIWETTTNLGLTESKRIVATELGYRHLDRLLQFFLR